MVTVNHIKSIQRIIDVILNDSNLYDNGATPGKLRSVEFGDPSANVKNTKHMPYLYVTTAPDLQETSPQTGVSLPDNVKSVTVEYQLVIVAQARDMTEKSQKQLYALTTDLRTRLEAEPTFTDPADPGVDPIFVRSIISDVNWDEQTRGQLVTSVTYTLLATIGALFFLEIPGVTDPIPLLSKPIDRDIDTIEDILDDTLILRDTAPVKSKRTITAEFETSSAILTALRATKDSRESDSFTITTPGGAEVVTAYLTQISSSTGFEEMETSIIQLDVINPII